MIQFTRPLALLLAAAALGACTTVLLPPNVQPVVASSTSGTQAKRRLEEVKAERTAAEAAFAQSEQVCYAKFFVNNCLDAAKEKRRSKLAVLRAVEVEAEYYLRKADVDQRDLEVAQAVEEFKAGEARMAAQPARAPRAKPAGVTPAPKAAAKVRPSRAAQQEALVRADGPQRAASAKAFTDRKLKSEQRQRDVEQRKADKAAKAASPGK